MAAAVEEQPQTGFTWDDDPKPQGGFQWDDQKPSDSSDFMVGTNPKGLVERGNLPIWDRPTVQNADGSHSSELSFSREDDGKEVLVPSIVNGKFMSPDGKKPPEGSPAEKAMQDRAWQHYKDTGEHLGKFDSPDSADAYADALHNRGPRPGQPATLDQALGAGRRLYQQSTQPKPVQPIATWANTDLLGKIQDFSRKVDQAAYGKDFDAQQKAALAEYDQNHPVQAGVNEGIQAWLHGMTTPAQIGALALLPSSRVLSAFFAAQAAKGAYQDSAAAYDAYKKGQNREATRFATEAGLGAAAAALGAHGAGSEPLYPPPRGYTTVLPPEPPAMGPGPRPPVEMPPNQPALPGGSGFVWDDARALPARTAGPSPALAPTPPVNAETARTRIAPTQFAQPPQPAPDRGVVVDQGGQALRGAPALPAPPKGFKPVGATPATQAPGAPAAGPQMASQAVPRPVIQSSANPEEIRASAERQQPVMEKATQVATQGVPGAEVEGMRVKEADSIANKEERGKPVETTADVLGARVSAPADQIAKVEQNIETKLPVVHKDTIDNNGVDATQYQIRTGTPGEANQVSEIQVITPEQAQAMKATEDLYEQQKQALVRGDREQAAILGAKIEREFELAKSAEERELPKIIKPQTRVQMQDGRTGTVMFYDQRTKNTRIRMDDGRMEWSVPRRALKPAPVSSTTTPSEKGETAANVNVPVSAMSANSLRTSEPMPEAKGDKWIGVDLDGTLAHYDGFKGPTAIGEPIPAMVDRVKNMLAAGNNVRILTARVSEDPGGEVKRAIEAWTEQHLGQKLPVTDVKDHHMVQLYDDRAVPVERNTGQLLAHPQPEGEANAGSQPRAEGVLQAQPQEAGVAGSGREGVAAGQREPQPAPARGGEAAAAPGFTWDKEAPLERAPQTERRTNVAERQRVAEMTPEQMRRELLTDTKTGLPNRRAFDEAQRSRPAAFVGMSDADGLKALNDKFGYEAGDSLLAAKAEALRMAGLEAYHDKGDEFLYRADSDPASKLEKAREILRSAPITATVDGKPATFKGADFSYGTGKDISAAESGLKAHKSEREARGERARGELRGITQAGPEPRKERAGAEAPAKPAAETAGVVQGQAGGGAEQPQPIEKKFKFGNTQHNIAPDSPAAKAIDQVRAKIPDADLAGDGKKIGENHVTVRYGIKGDTEGISSHLERQAPFEAKLGPVSSFPPSEHSDGAAVLVAPVESPELHQLNKELENHGDFTEPNFKEYKPHATIAYVKPEAVSKYMGDKATDGKTFTVDSVTISDRDGKQHEVSFKGSETAQSRMSQHAINNWKEAAHRGLSENVRNTAVMIRKWNDQPVLALNADAIVLLDKMAGLTPSSVGLSIAGHRADEFIQSLKTLARFAPDLADGANRLAFALSHRVGNGEGGVVIYYEGVDNTYRDQIMREEFFHNWQWRELNKEHKGAEAQLDRAMKEGPAATEYKTAIGMLTGPMGYASNPARNEAPAWMAAGSWTDLGLDREEAAKLLGTYLNEARKIAGEGALRRLPPIAEEIKDDVDRIVQAGSPRSNQADLRRGPAGGKHPLQPAQLELTFQRKIDTGRELSTRVPTGVKSEEDPLKKTLVVDLESLKNAPAANSSAPTPWQKAADLLQQYVNFSDLKGESADNTINEAIGRIARNLRWLHDNMPPEIRDRSKLWYDGARLIANRWARQYGKSPQQVAGAIAVLSPQRDWFQNLSLGERVLDIVTGKQDARWDKSMTAFADGNAALSQYPQLIAKVKNRQYGSLRDEALQALWLRVYDEAHNPRHFREVSPEGRLGDFVKTKAGEEHNIAWGSLDQIAKAISILNDGSPANISAQLGGAHKVRNFYNNIVSPNSRHPFVTIDTHAVAAGLLRPLAGRDIEVSHNLGEGVSSAHAGISGTYPIFAEAYKRAAASRDLLPREMQSITWEGVRGLFPAEFKTKANKEKVDEIWRRYTKDEVSLDDAHKQIHDLAGGITPPAWSDRETAEAGRGAPDKGKLVELGLPRGSAEGAARGSRAGTAGAIAAHRVAAAPATTYSGGFLDPQLFQILFPDIADSLKNWVTETVTPADEQREMMRETRGEKDRQVAAVSEKLRKVRNRWTLRSRADSINFWNAVEQQNIGSLDPEDQALARFFEGGFQPLIREIQQLKPEALQTLIDGYFPHIWERPSMVRRTLKQVISGRRPFAGSASFLKQRTIPTMADGLALGFTPISWNPVELFMRKYAEMSQYLMGYKTLDMMKTAGTAKMVRVGQKPPDGWQQLDDRIGTVYSYDDEGHLYIRGHYYAPQGAARVFNNYVSKGIAGRYALYDVARWLNNNMNALQLGISGFHAATTTVNAATSEVALGIQQLFEGKPIKAAGHLLSGATIAPSILRTVANGSRMMREYLNPGSYQKFAAEAKAIGASGGRAKMDTVEISPLRQFVNAIRNHSVKDAAFALPGAILHTSVAPVMEYLVPRVKLGAFYDMAHDILDEASSRNWDQDEIRRRMQRAWDSIDNRFGQLVYENLFWHRGLQDTLQLATRSVGWNFGSLRELGGAAQDVLREGAGVFAKKVPEITPRMGFAFALPIVTGLIGALLNYAWTHRWPLTWKDYFYPQRKDGTRVSIPGYMKDVIGFYIHPIDTIVAKQSPIIEMTAEIIQNRDFYGVEIRHKDDPVIKQLLQVASWFGRTVEPFSFSGTKKLLEKEGEPTDTIADVLKGAMKHPGDVAVGQFGFQPAPAVIQNSDALNKARDYQRDNFTPGTRTAEQAAKTNAMHQVEDMYRRKAVDRDAIKSFKDKGVLNEQDLLKARFDSRTDPLYASSKSLHPDQLLKVYQAGSTDEQRTLRPLLEQKEMELNTGKEEDRALRQAIRDALRSRPKAAAGARVG